MQEIFKNNFRNILLNKFAHTKPNALLWGINKSIMKVGTKKCWNNQCEIPYRLHGFDVVTATHPQKPNYSGHSRGRKIHLAKNETHTICNMLIDEYCPSPSQNYSMNGNGKCGNCFNPNAINKAKKS